MSFHRRGDEGPAVDWTEDLAPGRVLGQFKLVRFIARGGMGQVWEAQDLELRRTVALKLGLPGRLDHRSEEIFAREARAGARLNHPNIVSTLTFGMGDGWSWIAQELVPGSWTVKDLLDDLRAQERLPDGYHADVALFVARVADALQVAHDAGVIHRDVKPQNILITQDDQPKVTDFGLARVSDDSFASQTGDFAGTYAYMSPEQVTAKRMGLDHRTDIFSLGVVLYELLALRRPFEGDTAHQIAEKIIGYEPPEPRVLRSLCPRDLSVISSKALQKLPSERYSSMADFAADLRRYLANEPIRASPATTWTRARKWVRRNPVVSLGGALTLAAAGVISALLVLFVQKSRSLEDLNGVLEEKNQAILEERDVARANAARSEAARLVLESRRAESEGDLEVATMLAMASQSLAGSIEAREVIRRAGLLSNEVAGWKSPQGALAMARFTPSGSHVFTAVDEYMPMNPKHWSNRDFTARGWPLASGAGEVILQMPQDPKIGWDWPYVQAVDFVGDGIACIVAGSGWGWDPYEAHLLWWDFEADRLLQVMDLDSSKVIALAVDPVREAVWAGTTSGAVWIITGATARKPARLVPGVDHEDGCPITALTVDEASGRAAAAFEDRRVCILEAEEVHFLDTSALPDAADALAFLGDRVLMTSRGAAFVAGVDQAALRLESAEEWISASRERADEGLGLLVRVGLSGEVLSILASEVDGEPSFHLGSCEVGRDGTRLVGSIDRRLGRPSALAVADDATWVAVGGASGWLQFFERVDGGYAGRWVRRAHGDSVTDLEFSRELGGEADLVSCSEDQWVRVWRMPEVKDSHSSPTTHLEFEWDEQALQWGCVSEEFLHWRGQHPEAWEILDAHLRASPPILEPGESWVPNREACWLAGQEQFILGGRNCDYDKNDLIGEPYGESCILDGRTGDRIAMEGSPFFDFEVSSDGSRVAFAHRDFTFSIVDPATWRASCRFEAVELGRVAWCKEMEFRFAASGDYLSVIHAGIAGFDTTTGEPVHSLDEHVIDAYGVSYSADGRRFAWGGSWGNPGEPSGEIHVYETDSNEPIVSFRLPAARFPWTYYRQTRTRLSSGGDSVYAWDHSQLARFDLQAAEFRFVREVVGESGCTLLQEDAVVARWFEEDLGRGIVLLDSTSGELIERIVLEGQATDLRPEGSHGWSVEQDGIRVTRSLDPLEDIGVMSVRAADIARSVVDADTFPGVRGVLDSLTWPGAR